MARRLTAGAATGTRHGARPGEICPANLGAEPARPSAAPPPAGDGQNPGRPAPVGFLRRAWARPMWAHVAALALILLALVPLVGTGSSFSADEGAAIVQARSLARGDGWIVDHPFPAVDPDGRNYPLELSTEGDRGRAPFVKHPLNALVLAGADRVGGITAMVLLSLAGTAGAAALAAALAARLGRGLARPTLWLVGLGSPLLFDGYLVMAHSLGAALAAGAVIFGLRALEGRRFLISVVGAGVCLALAVLVRSEAVLLGAGVAAAAGMVAVRQRHRAAAGLALVAVVATGLARQGEQAWIALIVGGRPVTPGGAVDPGTGFVAARVNSLSLTWLWPSYGGDTWPAIALLIMLVALVAGAVATRRRPADQGVVVVGAVTAFAAAGVALAADPSHLVPGLLIAFPALGAGLAALRRSTLATPAARFAFVTFVVFALGVAATQYARGGGREWGGRYFALGLPVLAPLLVLALAGAAARLDAVVRRAATVALVSCTVALSAIGLGSLRDAHRFTDRVVTAVDRTGRPLGDRPVMVTTSGTMPRLAWATFDRQRWLLASPTQLDALLDRLRDAGLDRVVLVTDSPSRDQAELGPDVSVVPTDVPVPRGRWRVVVLGLGR